MVTLYNLDALVVRDRLALLAAFANSQKSSGDLAQWVDTIATAHSPRIAADNPSQRATSQRLCSRRSSLRSTTSSVAGRERLPRDTKPARLGNAAGRAASPPLNNRYKLPVRPQVFSPRSRARNKISWPTSTA
jgi:hypothetical protein